MAIPHCGNKLLMGNIGRVVFVHVDLFEHDVALGVNFGLSELGADEHLGENLDTCLDVGISHASPVAGVFA